MHGAGSWRAWLGPGLGLGLGLGLVSGSGLGLGSGSGLARCRQLARLAQRLCAVDQGRELRLDLAEQPGGGAAVVTPGAARAGLASWRARLQLTRVEQVQPPPARLG